MYQIQLYNAQSAAQLLAVLTHRCAEATIRRDLRGDSTATVRVRMPNAEAFKLYDQQGMQRLDVYDDGLLIWRGRVDDLTLTPDGIQIGAFGYQQALRDTRYTALWSDTSTARWEEFRETTDANLAPDRGEFDTNNRLRIVPRVGETYSSSAYLALWYRAPNGSSRTITRFAANYSHTLPSATWRTGVQERQEDGTVLATVLSLNGTGALQTGSIAQAISNDPAIGVFVQYNAAAAVFAGLTNTAYGTWTEVRVTSATPPITADLIIDDLVAAISTANPDLLSSATGLVGNPGIDLTDAIYEDAVPSDILDSFALRGDTSGNMWRWWVDRNRVLRFAAMPQWFDGTSQIYSVDVSSVEASRSTRAVRNRMLARYQDANGRTLRTAAANNSSSQRRYGAVLQDTVDADTTSSSTATTIRDTALADAALPTPRAAVTTNRLYAFNGTRMPISRLEPGDFVVLRNILPGFVSDANALRTVQVSEVELNLISGTLTFTPLVPIPTLDRLIAERG